MNKKRSKSTNECSACKEEISELHEVIDTLLTKMGHLVDINKTVITELLNINNSLNGEGDEND